MCSHRKAVCAHLPTEGTPQHTTRERSHMKLPILEDNPTCRGHGRAAVQSECRSRLCVIGIALARVTLQTKGRGVRGRLTRRRSPFCEPRREDRLGTKGQSSVLFCSVLFSSVQFCSVELCDLTCAFSLERTSHAFRANAAYSPSALGARPGRACGPPSPVWIRDFSCWIPAGILLAPQNRPLKPIHSV